YLAEELHVDTAYHASREASRPPLQLRPHEHVVRRQLPGAAGGDAVDGLRGLRAAVEADPVRVPKPGAPEAGEGGRGGEAAAEPERARTAQAGDPAGPGGARSAPQGSRQAGIRGQGQEDPV